MSLRVGDDLLVSAKLAADVAGRSAAQQIGYWAKLGREVERSGSLSVREIAEVLAGARSYDDLDPKAQAIVRSEWDARIDARREALNLAEVFAAEGRSWVEMGRDGATVRHPASSDTAATTRRSPRGAAVGADAPTRKRSRPAEKAQEDGKGPAVRTVDPKKPAAETKPDGKKVTKKADATKPVATKAVSRKTAAQKKASTSAH